MSVTAPTHGDQPADAAQGKPSRKRLLIAIGFVAIVAALAWGVRWWTVGRFIESTDDAYLQGRQRDRRAQGVRLRDRSARCRQPAVAAGAALVRLDRRQYQAALDQAKATIDARKADIQRARGRAPPAAGQRRQAKRAGRSVAREPRARRDE